jgi:hypothetical protein
MRKIIYTLNAAVSGLASIIALLTGFYEVRGVKLILFVAMGFAVMWHGLLWIEKKILKRGRNEKAGDRKGTQSLIPGIPWHKMRFKLAGKQDRNTSANITQIQKRAGGYPVRKTVGYR